MIWLNNMQFSVRQHRLQVVVEGIQLRLLNFSIKVEFLSRLLFLIKHRQTIIKAVVPTSAQTQVKLSLQYQL